MYRLGRATGAAMLAAVLGWALDGIALECPAMPQHAQRDWDMAVAVAVGRLGQAAGPQLQAQTRTVTTDLLRRLPGADRVYLEQMMYATYCSSLRDNAALTEVERNARIQAYNRELRATLNVNVNARPAATVDPRDVARAELARLPVEYSAAVFLASAEAGKTAVVRLFLQAGIDPNAADRRGATALMHAAGRNDLPMLQMLLTARAAVNARMSGSDATAMSWAAGSGKLDAMRVLMKAGAAKESFDRALLVALRGGHVDAVRLLLEQGANARADDGETGRWFTMAPRDIDPARLAEMVNLLLKRGWPVNARTRDGWTALMAAADNNHPALVDLLLRAGAAVDLHCECTGFLGGGYTALTMASKREGSEQVVRLLLDAPAQVDEPSNDGTPLMVASEHGSLDVVKLLLSKGADPNKARNREGDTALMHAVLHYNNLEIVSLLLAAGADVNGHGKTGVTALMWAAERNEPAVARKLLDAGAQLELTTQRGRTALMLAAMSGSADTARLLMQRGARIDAVDADNRSALAHASATLKGDERARMLTLFGQKESK